MPVRWPTPRSGKLFRMEHRTDCQLLTVTTYGLCTCDFDQRAKEVCAEQLAVMNRIEPMVTCTRCGQSMEHKDQAEGCEDFFCPLG